MTMTTKQDMVDQGWNLGVEYPDDGPDVVDEDWLSGASCNTDDPEECEACQ